MNVQNYPMGESNFACFLFGRPRLGIYCGSFGLSKISKGCWYTEITTKLGASRCSAAQRFGRGIGWDSVWVVKFPFLNLERKISFLRFSIKEQRQICAQENYHPIPSPNPDRAAVLSATRKYPKTTKGREDAGLSE